ESIPLHDVKQQTEHNQRRLEKCCYSIHDSKSNAQTVTELDLCLERKSHNTVPVYFRAGDPLSILCIYANGRQAGVRRNTGAMSQSPMGEEEEIGMMAEEERISGRRGRSLGLLQNLQRSGQVLSLYAPLSLTYIHTAGQMDERRASIVWPLPLTCIRHADSFPFAQITWASGQWEETEQDPSEEQQKEKRWMVSKVTYEINSFCC
ncbi:hypothetical protein PO909_011425, partial [Leuciscus waleckii]